MCKILLIKIYIVVTVSVRHKAYTVKNNKLSGEETSNMDIVSASDMEIS